MRIEQTSKAHRDMKMKYLLKPMQCFHSTLSDCRPCFIHVALFMWLWLRLQRRGRSPLTNRQLIILTSLSLSLSHFLSGARWEWEQCAQKWIVSCLLWFGDFFILIFLFICINSFEILFSHQSIMLLIWNGVRISVLLLRALWKIL